ELERRLGQSGAQVRLERKIDPRVVGGLKVKMGDLVIDGTTKSQLVKLERELLEVL
ncbi:MAG: F0F1 ATP synthase subunit delta, partial [Deinococcus sp.]|nr:F0F1 ATP synthase subunit delta [Deinococcus sp.]